MREAVIICIKHHDCYHQYDKINYSFASFQRPTNLAIIFYNKMYHKFKRQLNLNIQRNYLSMDGLCFYVQF